MIGVWLAIGILAVAFVIGLVQVAIATDEASRAVVGDLTFFIAVATLVMVGMLKESSAVLDAALIASLIGILATIALARIITRGRR